MKMSTDMCVYIQNAFMNLGETHKKKKDRKVCKQDPRKKKQQPKNQDYVRKEQ